MDSAENGKEIVAKVVETEPREIDLCADARRRAELFHDLIPSLLKCCHEKDLIDFGGRPYVADSGCEKIARVAGISFSTPVVTAGFEDDGSGGRIYAVTIRGEASVLGQSIYEVGGCDEMDKFTESRKLPLIHRKLEVEKKAYCNWRGRCVRTILGLSGLTWADLERYGVKREGRSKVEFKAGSKSHDSKTPEEQAEKADEVREKIRQQLLKDLGGNATACQVALMRLTSFKTAEGKEVGGVSTVSDKKFSDKWAFACWAKIKPGGKDTEGYAAIICETLEKYPAKAQEREPGQEG